MYSVYNPYFIWEHALKLVFIILHPIEFQSNPSKCYGGEIISISVEVLYHGSKKGFSKTFDI